MGKRGNRHLPKACASAPLPQGRRLPGCTDESPGPGRSSLLCGSVCEPCALLSVMTPAPTALSPRQDKRRENGGPHAPCLGSMGAWVTPQTLTALHSLCCDSRAVLKGAQECHSRPRTRRGTQLNARAAQQSRIYSKHKVGLQSKYFYE